MHGGGFTQGGLDVPHAHLVSAQLAHRTPAVVVSVGYRLATGGVHYPVPHDDVRSAWAWACGRAREPGPAPERFAMGGASAGANLAVGVAQHLRDDGAPLPAALLLAYPLVHEVVPEASAELMARLAELSGPVPGVRRFPPEAVTAMYRHYAGPRGGRYVHPATAGAAGLPPTLIVTAEYDDLRPSGEAFAAQLAAAGVRVDLAMARGMPHSFLNWPPELPAISWTLRRFTRVLRELGRP
nr:alpha/beta hydrolase fold domain-containing protein [Streptomyces sp. SID8354]